MNRRSAASGLGSTALAALRSSYAATMKSPAKFTSVSMSLLMLAGLMSGCGTSYKAMADNVHEHFDEMPGVDSVETNGMDTLPFLGSIDADVHLEPGLPMADVERVYEEILRFPDLGPGERNTVIADGVKVSVTNDEAAREASLSWFEALRANDMVEDPQVIAVEHDVEVTVQAPGRIAQAFRGLRQACKGQPCDDIALTVVDDPGGAASDSQGLTITDRPGDHDGWTRSDVEPALRVYEALTRETAIGEAEISPSLTLVMVVHEDDLVPVRAEGQALGRKHDVPVFVGGGGIVGGIGDAADVDRINTVIDELLADGTASGIWGTSITVPDVEGLAAVAELLQNVPEADGMSFTIGVYESDDGHNTETQIEGTTIHLPELADVARAVRGAESLHVEAGEKHPVIDVEIAEPERVEKLIADMRAVLVHGSMVTVRTEEFHFRTPSVAFRAQDRVRAHFEDAAGEDERRRQKRLAASIEETWNQHGVTK